MRGAACARYLSLDLAPRAKAGVEHTQRIEPVERAPVVVEMLRLLARRPVPVDAEPGEVREYCCGIFVAAAGPADVLEAEQKAARPAPRCAPPLERRADMPEMQIAGRARREPCPRPAAPRRYG